MKVIIACEFSGVVRDAFASRGHDAWSCDLLPTERPGQHIHGDVLEVLGQSWDLLIAHPPCTHLSASGARWWKNKQREQAEALEFFGAFLEADHIPHRCIENPIGLPSTIFGKPDQIIQPWQFGHGETKATCLWLRGLQRLTPSRIVTGRHERCHRMPQSKDRWKNRSRTLQGIAEAMANQWG